MQYQPLSSLSFLKDVLFNGKDPAQTPQPSKPNYFAGSGYNNSSTVNAPAPSPYAVGSGRFPTPKNTPMPSVSPMGVQVAQPQTKPASTVAPDSQVANAPRQTQPIQSQQAASVYQSFPGLLGNLSNASTQGNPSSRTAQTSLLGQAQNPSPANPAINGLYGMSQSPNPAVTAAQTDYNKFAQENPYMLAAQHNPNVAADIASGRDSLLGQTFAAELSAKQAAVNNALEAQGQQITAGQAAGNLGLNAQGQQITAANEAGGLGNTAQGQAITGLGTAAGLAQPVQVSPANSLISPQNGNEVYQGLGLTGLGVVNQNIASGQKFQEQAANLSNTLNQIDTLAPILTNFLTQSQLNDSRFPQANQSVNAYIDDLKNPAAIRGGLNLYMNDLKNYQQQIIAQSGGTPTGHEAQVLSVDPTNLNIKDLVPWIENLRNIGQARLQPLQQSATSAYGSNRNGGSNPYVGSPANPSINSSYAPDITGKDVSNLVGNNQKLGEAIIGTGLRAPGEVAGLAGWITSHL